MAWQNCRWTSFQHLTPVLVSLTLSQFLESYKSVTLSSMATAFDVSTAFLDQGGCVWRVPEVLFTRWAWASGPYVQPGAALTSPGGPWRAQKSASHDPSLDAHSTPSNNVSLVSTFANAEVADLIVAGRLSAKIDKVAGVIETNR